MTYMHMALGFLHLNLTPSSILPLMHLSILIPSKLNFMLTCPLHLLMLKSIPQDILKLAIVAFNSLYS